MRVAVIGAGVVGASAAWQLARAGADTVLIDADLEGRATAAGAGIVVPWAGAHQPDPEWHRRGVAAGRIYPEIIAALSEDGETDTGYARCGALIVDANPAVLDRVERELLERRAEAPEMGDVSRLDPSQARAAFPLLHPALFGLHIAGGARVDGRRLAPALRRAAVRRGVPEMGGVARLIRRPGHIGVQVDGVNLPAEVVLVAAGAWSAALCRCAGCCKSVVGSTNLAPASAQCRIGCSGDRRRHWLDRGHRPRSDFSHSALGVLVIDSLPCGRCGSRCYPRYRLGACDRSH